MRTAGLLAAGLCPSVRAAQQRAIDAIGARLEPARKLVYKEVDGRKLHLHLFEPEGAAPEGGRPAFLIIHGGGWTGGAPRQFYPMADYFARKGMLAACLEYRLMRVGSGETPAMCVRDARSAMRYLKSHAGELAIHPARIAAGGGSAGGHLAAGTALFTGMDEAGDMRQLDPTPAALVLWYPVIDTSEQGYGHAKCGAEWRSLSPLHQVRAGLPPTRLFHGTGDTVTPYAGAEAFDRAMRTAGNECELIPHPGGVHGYFLYDLQLFEDAMARTARFLQSKRLIP